MHPRSAMCIVKGKKAKKYKCHLFHLNKAFFPGISEDFSKSNLPLYIYCWSIKNLRSTYLSQGLKSQSAIRGHLRKDAHQFFIRFIDVRPKLQHVILFNRYTRTIGRGRTNRMLHAATFS